jgi:surface protein
MFSNCYSLTSIDLSNFNFKKAKYIFGFFQLCYNLEKIIWPNNKDNSLIEIPAYMFANCTKLTSIDLSFFDFSKVKLMYYLFFNCYNLEKIIFPSNNILSIEDINRMFYGCKKLNSIDLSTFGFNKTYDMSYLFYNCEKLNTIIWPKETSSYDCCTYSHMFSNCYSLTSIDLSNFYMHGIIDLSYIFSGCINLQNIEWIY